MLANYLSGLGNVHALYVRMFVKEFVPELKDAVLKNLLQSPEVNIRNMGKEKLDLILKAMENLLKRNYSLGYKFEFIEKLSLELAILCFKSNFLDKKVQSLKFISDLGRMVRSCYYKVITLEYLQNYINEH